MDRARFLFHFRGSFRRLPSESEETVLDEIVVLSRRLDGGSAMETSRPRTSAERSDMVGTKEVFRRAVDPERHGRDSFGGPQGAEPPA